MKGKKADPAVPYGEGQETPQPRTELPIEGNDWNPWNNSNNWSFFPSLFPPTCFFLTEILFPCHLPFPSQSISSHFQTRANSVGIHHTCCCFHGTAAVLSAKLITHQFPLPPRPAGWNNRSFLSPSSLPPSPTHLGRPWQRRWEKKESSKSLQQTKTSTTRACCHHVCPLLNLEAWGCKAGWYSSVQQHWYRIGNKVDTILKSYEGFFSLQIIF